MRTTEIRTLDMKICAVSLGVMSVALVVLSCGQQPVPAVEETVNTDSDVEAVDNVIETWIRLTNANEGDGLIGLTCSDLEVIPPEGPPVSGAEARQLFLGFLENFTVALKSTTTEVSVCGDWAFRQYAYELTLTPQDGGEPLTERGHGIHMFKRKQDGSWCLAKDIWNSLPALTETS